MTPTYILHAVYVQMTLTIFRKKVCVQEIRSFCELYNMDGGTVGSDCLEEGYTSGEHSMFIGQCVKQEWMYVITLCESITHISVVLCKFKT